jgi:hypothetical protein
VFTFSAPPRVLYLHREDERIVGIAPWHWLNCSGCASFKDEIGLAYTPQARQAWATIGAEIKSGVKGRLQLTDRVASDEPRVQRQRRRGA